MHYYYSEKKPADTQHVQFLKLKSLDVVADLGTVLKQNNQTIEIRKGDDRWQLQSLDDTRVLQKISDNNTPLKNMFDSEIFRGIVTGYNEAFIIDTATKERLCKENSNSKDIIKPLLIGKDIKRYIYDWEKLWIIFTRRGVNINNYPVVLEYLSQFKEKLEPGIGRKPGSYKWYEIQDNIAYYEEFEKPKIIWGNLTIHSSFSYDTDKFYITAPACILSTNEKWLVALLNSTVCTFFLRNTAIERQGGFIEQKPMYVREVPIPSVTEDVKEALSKNVDILLQLHRERDEYISQAVQILETEYAIKKVTHKLENFLSLGWNEFIEELEKQHTLFSLQQKDELNKWFRGKQKGFQVLENNTKKVDDSVDTEIYELYHLSNIDIQIVLRSLQQSNTPNNY